VARSRKQAIEGLSAQEKDAVHARLAEKTVSNNAVPKALRHMAHDPRITVRRGGLPDASGQHGRKFDAENYIAQMNGLSG
jgi:hypothetical protein